MTIHFGSGRGFTPALTLIAFIAVNGCSSTHSNTEADSAIRTKLAQLSEPPGNSGEQLASLGLAASQSPDNSAIQIRYAAALANAGRNLQALQVANQVYDRDKGPTSLGLLVGRLHIRLEESEAAAATYRQVLGKEPENIEALNGLGIAEVMQGTLAAAETALRHAVADAPADAFSRNNLALALALERKTDEAIPTLQALLREDSSSRRVRANLALAYTLSGDREKAAATLLPIMNSAEAQKAVDGYSRIGVTGQTSVQQSAADGPPVNLLAASDGHPAPVR